jgi:peroxiredoxin
MFTRRVQKIGWTAAILLAALGPARIVAGADGEPSPDTAPPGPNPLVMLARASSVQAALGVDRRQADAIDNAVRAVDEPLWRLRDLPRTQSSQEIKRLSDSFHAELQQILRPQQLQRLQQIAMRAKGWDALLSPAIAESLRISDEQLDRIRRILDDNMKPGREAARESDAAKAKRIASVLSGPQREQLSRLVGKPFDFSQFRQLAVMAPELRNVAEWINSEPMALSDLRGKVVALHFWTFGCSNCIHNYPAYKNWRRQIPTERFVILGIHTPETAAEHDVAQIRRAVEKAGLEFPIAVDNQGENWAAWGNHVWPSVYLIDRNGYVRYWWYGELNWNGAKGERLFRERIEQLLAEKP